MKKSGWGRLLRSSHAPVVSGLNLDMSVVVPVQVALPTLGLGYRTGWEFLAHTVEGARRGTSRRAFPPAASGAAPTPPHHAPGAPRRGPPQLASPRNPAPPRMVTGFGFSAFGFWSLEVPAWESLVPSTSCVTKQNSDAGWTY